MPLQHFLPATYLACFSTDTNPERRRRILAVGDKEDGKVFSAPASRVCGKNDFYTLADSTDNPDLVDRVWTFYEKGLALAFDQLIQGTIPCSIWANTLVPFVTGLLTRGPDFNQRFESRLADIGVTPVLGPGDNTNLARLMESQRLSSSVLGAKWIVLRAYGDDPLITNDLGYAPFANPSTHDFGIAIPISLEYILMIAPKLKRKIAIGLGGIWWPIIEHLDLPENDHIGLNQTVASFSQRFLFGPSSDSVSRYLYEQKELTKVPEPEELGFMNGSLARIHEMTWLDLMTTLSTKPAHDGDLLCVNYMEVENIRSTQPRPKRALRLLPRR